ncbi:hydroxyglutarate oxidase [Humibacillus sp. DSM 29435]|uniref:L-2-hydroxyglutarate oxidase n=1 Tax=Humibacillus sp. DSM 29435 TaxID=1869167 RepID=UPI0008726278|nr:L-2-hydroxyglutarate oxidase [Humibacillus sp. DSM 29435]OFE14599.1 hydroxyglutarate oxidase [Humibacillus sp. DSM 29435]
MVSGPRYVVIGGGIVGLAVADRLSVDDPTAHVSVLEKEQTWASHQTGRNSGVIHSGLYYPPGSQKASMCKAGATSMVRFAEEEGIAHEVCGKLVVATDRAELPGLQRLHDRGLANGLEVRRLNAEQAREYEPHISAVGALHVAATGIIDYGAVCAALVRRLERRGVLLRLGTEVLGATTRGAETLVQTSTGTIAADVVVACAGLHSDLVARRLGHSPSARIIPFRGEYYELTPEATPLVQGLIYPVPNPDFPFLGVHLTRGVDGHVHAGPNAVLAFAREGYTWGTIKPREVYDALTFPGFWKLARRNYRAGSKEMARSASRRLFGDSLRRLVPEIRDEHLTKATAGVRAQAMKPDGSLVDDFLIERTGAIVHVLNAPSPAATAALEIARHIAALVTSGR